MLCFHCGDICPDDKVFIEDKFFCCNGCKSVHILLSENDLSHVYEEAKVGSSSNKKFGKDEFAFLDDSIIIDKLIKFKIDTRSRVVFHLPQIYCSACLYLIENINLLDKGIIESKVNFLKKEVTITYYHELTSLRKIVELLTGLGYKPTLNLSDIEQPRKASHNRNLYIKLGIAGFAFGNIMLMAIPEYISGGMIESDIRTFMGYVSILLGIPVMYAASDYFKGAWNGLKMKIVNIDVPLSLGILVLFLRSVYDILFTTEPGFIDSLTGLVFFLLVGKLFQQKTYHNLSFHRDYKSYFPLSVIKLEDGNELYIPVSKINPGDVLLIRNDELIPADSLLESDYALVDYSFVTGESTPVSVKMGDKLYAGGKLIGSASRIRVIKKFSSSYLTELWNSKSFDKVKESTISNISNTAAKYFTLIILLIAVATAFYWVPEDLNIAMNAVTAVLIIACPCAIALSIPFSYGTTMRLLGNRNLFLKSDKIVEYITFANVVIFDKTGTLTEMSKTEIKFVGDNLSEISLIAVKSLAKNSTHPLSRIIAENLDCNYKELHDFEEVPGKGTKAIINDVLYMLGSKQWMNDNGISFFPEQSDTQPEFNTESKVYLSVGNKLLGFFAISSKYRPGLKTLFSNLKSKHSLYILSGDNDAERSNLEQIAGHNVEMYFNLMPQDKYNFITDLQKQGKKVIMLGDGLNDAGALNKSDVGIAVTESDSNFTPGSDAILLARELHNLPKMLKLAQNGVNTVLVSYILSVIYHTIGFYFAVQGLLSPLIAAILMPVSSISVIALTVGSALIADKRIGRNHRD